MDLGEKRGEDHLAYHDLSIIGDWRFGNNPQAGFFTPTHASSVPIRPGDQMMGSSPSPAPMAGGSFGRSLYSQNPSFSDADVQGNPLLAPKGGAFFPNGAGILPTGLSQFPTDYGFIERAARFSCFNGVNVGAMASPFVARGSPIPLSNAQRNELSLGGALKDVSMPVDNGSGVGSPLRNPKGNESCEQEFSVGGQEEAPESENTAGEPSSIGFGARKRKRGNQEMELDQAEADNQISVGTSKENADVKRKGDQENSTSPAAKPSGKHGKENSVDAPKVDYVHVRARRGQATNSHSLAERVRREKISERMKFLQDLVPGCSKVTGKAVMLDEIINYVQSLQRQVEFLSMKLAAVNPRLDINIEGLLSKEMLQSRAVSSTIEFSPDMTHPQLHPAQQAFVRPGIPGMGNPSDALRRTLNAQLTAMNAYRDHANQVQIPSAWDTELQNVVQMGFGSNATLNIQELHGLPLLGHMKIEP